MAPKTIRLGTASPGTQESTAATLKQLSQLARQAAASSIDILLLPEAYLGGYPRGSGFGCIIGNRSAEGRDEFLKYFEDAVDLGDTVGDGAGAGAAWVKRELGPDGREPFEVAGRKVERGDGTREELERIASETGVFLVTGLIEKAGGSLYCGVVYVCPKQGIIGKRRKVMPVRHPLFVFQFRQCICLTFQTGSERLIWAQGSPVTLRAVSTTIRGVRVNLAAAICWESYMPLLRQALYSQNINLYLAPTADGRDGWLSLMRSVGVEGRCFVVSSNMCVRSGPKASTSNGTVPISQGDRQPYENSTRGRRNSALTEEGHEIALPSSPKSSQKGPRQRRKSVLDEDGNEIVLCRNNDAIAEDEEATGDSVQIAPKLNGQKQPAEFISRGGSNIVSPFGDVLAGPQWEDENGIIYTDVDFQDCIRGRLDLDAGGSYSRNDSFKFSVDGLDLSPLPY